MDYGYIGGADGPTSIFIAGQVGGNWLNVFGLILVILILIPNIIYAIKFKDVKNECTNKFMNILEQIGRYACMIFMVFNLGLAKFGFTSVAAFLIYFLGNVALLLAYWIIWILFFIKQTSWKSMALAIIPVWIFLICGVTLKHVLLIVSAVIFAVGHIYVTVQNLKSTNKMHVNILEFLENATAGEHSLDELISAFEKMCEIPIAEEAEKMILFETGTYSFTGKPMFDFSLVRQYPNEEDEYYQLHLDIMFDPTFDNSSFQQATWSIDIKENIFDYIRKSKEYLYLKEIPIAKVVVYMDET